MVSRGAKFVFENVLVGVVAAVVVCFILGRLRHFSVLSTAVRVRFVAKCLSCACSLE